MQKISVATMFDCTNSGVRSYRRGDLNDEDWNFKRNQQRNWETVLQCVSLRCQPLNISGPYCFSNENDQLYWTFNFEIDRQDIFLQDNDPLGALKADCHGVPMLVGLNESIKELFLTPYLITTGDQPNTVFVLDDGK